MFGAYILIYICIVQCQQIDSIWTCMLIKEHWYSKSTKVMRIVKAAVCISFISDWLPFPCTWFLCHVYPFYCTYPFRVFVYVRFFFCWKWQDDIPPQFDNHKLPNRNTLIAYSKKLLLNILKQIYLAQDSRKILGYLLPTSMIMIVSQYQCIALDTAK